MGGDLASNYPRDYPGGYSSGDAILKNGVEVIKIVFFETFSSYKTFAKSFDITM